MSVSPSAVTRATRPASVLLAALAVIAALSARTSLAEQPGPDANLPTVEGGGVTLHSVSVDLPDGDRIFAGGQAADPINNNCLACHSAGMILTQPRLSEVEWHAMVEKMRHTYKAPVATEDAPAIVDYLATMNVGK